MLRLVLAAFLVLAIGGGAVACGGGGGGQPLPSQGY